MKIHTLFVEFPGAASQANLVDFWGRSWAAYGWTPTFLDWNSPMGELGQRLHDAAARFPTLNGRDFEWACFARWAMMAQIGGAMADFDVINYGVTPKGIVPTSVLHSGGGRDPGFLVGTAKAYADMCERFISYPVPAGTKHVSDMTLLQHFARHVFDTRQAIVYGRPGWEDSPLVHYGAASVAHLPGKDRLAKILAARL